MRADNRGEDPVQQGDGRNGRRAETYASDDPRAGDCGLGRVPGGPQKGDAGGDGRRAGHGSRRELPGPGEDDGGVAVDNYRRNGRRTTAAIAATTARTHRQTTYHNETETPHDGLPGLGCYGTSVLGRDRHTPIHTGVVCAVIVVCPRRREGPLRASLCLVRDVRRRIRCGKSDVVCGGRP